MGGIGVVVEPLVVIALLFAGTWINRDFDPGRNRRRRDVRRVSNDVDLGKAKRAGSSNADEQLGDLRSSSPSLLAGQEPNWRTRRIGIWGFEREVITPNTRRFKGYFLSNTTAEVPIPCGVEC